MSGEQDENQVVYYTTASVVRAASTGEATPDDLMKLILKHAKDPTIFTQDGVIPFTWMAEVSSGRLDSYFTRQDMQSLKNYARDASTGVMFLDSHDKRQLGFGQSIRGVYTGTTGKVDEKKPEDDALGTVNVDFFTVPGLSLGRADSDSFIRGVRSGVINDVSIGFMPESFSCNLCGEDPFDWWSMECMHIPGAYYDSTGKNIVTKKSQGATQAFAWVRNSRLLEVSAVYDGAAPGAFIKKAQWLAEAGEVNRASAGILERQLRIHLPEQVMRVPVLKIDGDRMVLARGSAVIDGKEYGEGMEVMPMTFRRLAERSQGDPEPEATGEQTDATPTPPSENPNLKREETPEGVASTSGGITSAAHADPEDLRMSGLSEDQVRELQQQAKASADTVGAVRRALALCGIKDAETADPVEAIGELHRQITELTPRAQLGDEWRAQEIERALENGVRAMDKDFNRDEWEATFKSMPVKQIQLLSTSWDRQAPNLGGGRRTADVGTESPKDSDKKADVTPPVQFGVNGRR